MRIALVCWSSRKVGGTESYLHHLLPALARTQEIALFCEIDRPAHLPSPNIPPTVPFWVVEHQGASAALAALRHWQPTVIYLHGLQDRALEAQLLAIAPVVFAAHDYSGFCISGTKTWQQPQLQHCQQSFGKSCFLSYYPRRCGGLNPLTMWREYQRQAQRQANLRQCQQIVVFSRYTQQIHQQHGITAHWLPYPYETVTSPPAMLARSLPIINHLAAKPPADNFSPAETASDRYRLLFLGRMDNLKGGAIMLQALPLVADHLPGMFQVTFAGDGPYRSQWQQLASTISARQPLLQIDFPGWVDSQTRTNLFLSNNLLIVPSIWPEPFGLIGQEAGQYGLPVAAFAAGGIPDWLQEGVNGHLAPANPPTAKGLAQAIIQCLANLEHYQQLCQGAQRLSQRVSLTEHLTTLLPILTVASRKPQ
jgi:glycosyltransferase involved in cell wall biosynthesis